ncbi:MAG: hypothetical protein KA198_01635 [Chitinophagaceae bacterium]|nr:hypothetical protein [Chitinophagaceae bacterium]
MKKLITFIHCTLFAVAVFAQDSKTLSPEIKTQIEILKNSTLQLSDIQISRITTVLVGEEMNYQRVLKSLNGNKSQLEIHLKELKEHKIQNIKGAMTPLQKEIFDNLKLDSKFN